MPRKKRLFDGKHKHLTGVTIHFDYFEDGKEIPIEDTLWFHGWHINNFEELPEPLREALQDFLDSRLEKGKP